jgi:hypothetical protein
MHEEDKVVYCFWWENAAAERSLPQTFLTWQNAGRVGPFLFGVDEDATKRYFIGNNLL